MRCRRRRHHRRPWGYEAGQSGVGDIFAWYVEQAVPAEYTERAAAMGMSVHELMTGLAAEIPPGGHGLVALDWWSGNRSVLVDHHLSGMIVGLTLATRPAEIYRALLESTAFGTRTIIDAFDRSGVPVTELVIAGGLLKNGLLMQMYADVTGRPLSLIGSEQGPALGAAIHAAVAAGEYPGRSGRGRGDGPDRAQRLPAQPRLRLGLRRPVRRVHAPARLLRPRRERGHAPPARDSRPCGHG